MADIVIRGVEMPHYCRMCPLSVGFAACGIVKEKIEGGYCNKWHRGAGRPDWCPLVPLPEGHEWISVKDRLPEIGLAVLVYCKAETSDFSDMIEVSVRNMYKPTPWSDEEPVWGIRFIPFGGAFEVTHWMPLPEPPKEGGGEDG